MKSNIKQLISGLPSLWRGRGRLLMLGLATLALASCGDVADEITSIIYGRNFSPTNLEARVVNRTNVRLTWTPVEGATSYNIEVFANDSLSFQGTPEKTITGITNAQIPYTVTGLYGQTQYSFRVQAVTEGAESRNSKWSGAYAKTESEQILFSVTDDDITATSVTLRWPAGEAADLLTLNPGNITHTVTAAEVAAGAATVTGLSPETTYTATLSRQGKVRGKVEFTTAIDLGGAIAVNPGDDLAAIVASAENGATLALFPGIYGIKTEEAEFGGSLTIDKNLSIKSVRAADRAVIQGRVKIDNASLDLYQVVLDGTGTDGGQCFDFVADGAVDHLAIEDCEVRNYTKGFYYINKAVKVQNITINNCLIHDIECSGGDFLDSRKGVFKNLTMTNTTVYNCAKERDVVRMDNVGDFADVAPVIKFDHCTFANVGSGGANYRFFYVRHAGNTITFTNNIVTDFCNKRGFANQKTTDANPKLENNYYWNTQNLLSLAEGNTEAISWFDTAGKEVDPQFKNAAAGDFTVGNEDVKYYGIGDPRWTK